ncbi:MAG: hypothetical protein ACLPVI_07455 [Dehalococcoidales bacterium]
MTTNSQNKPANAWKSTTAGILSIIAGALAIIFAFTMFHRHEVIGLLNHGGRWRVWGCIVLLLGIMSIIGGIFAIMRKAWGVALAGAITALYPYGVFGILAIIFVAMGKPEFSKPVAKEAAAPASGTETKSLGSKT